MCYRTSKEAKKPDRSTWKKGCVCLRDSQQTWKPSPEEKMELAKMGLGLREVIFSTTAHSSCYPTKISGVGHHWGLHVALSWRKF